MRFCNQLKHTCDWWHPKDGHITVGSRPLDSKWHPWT